MNYEDLDPIDKIKAERNLQSKFTAEFMAKNRFDPMFRAVYQMILHGESPYKMIETLLDDRITVIDNFNKHLQYCTKYEPVMKS